MSKNKLQELAQRHCLSLPIYGSTKDGPDHAPRFRATVKYNERVYHSPGYCGSLKQAETAAAEAALRQLESEHNLQKMEEPVSGQMGPFEVPSNLPRESNKEQKSERKEEKLRQAENVACISKGGNANVLENGELKAKSSQLTQSPRVPFPSSRIQVVNVRELSKFENSGKATDKINILRNSLIPEFPCNETNTEQAHRMAVGATQEKQQTEEVLQQSKVQMVPFEVPSNLPRESNKEQKSERKEEKLQQAENVACISKGGNANVLENGELKAKSSQLTQSPHVPFPSSRIQVVNVRELSKFENSGKATDKLNILRNSLIPEFPCNETNTEQAHRMAVGAMQEKQQTEEVLQQSKVQMSSVEAPSNLQKESKKEQIGDREEETLQEVEDASVISESGIANLPKKSELKAQGYTMFENSGKVIDKQSTCNISLTPEISCNETHREQAHTMGVGMIEDRQWNKEINKQSEGIMSTPRFISDMHKTQLQEFAIKGGFNLPCYSSIREGSPHALRFKATVQFNGETYEGPGFFNTLRQAEHAAAAVALKSLSDKGSSLDELSMYKNLLQEKAQKEGKPLPVYNTTKSGPPHMPIFTCTLKFDGMKFEGKHANTKKQAEKNAAAVAWSALENCKRLSLSTQQLHDNKVKGLTYEPDDHEQVHLRNHIKREATQELDSQFSHCGLHRNLSTVSHSPPSEALSMGSKKELLHTTNVAGDKVKNEVQASNMSPPTKHSSGTRIRVLPDCSSSSKPWLAVNISGGTIQNQKNAP